MDSLSEGRQDIVDWLRTAAALGTMVVCYNLRLALQNVVLS